MREIVPPKRLSGAAEMRRKRVFAVVPTLLTLGNAVCGFASITLAARVGPNGPPLDPMVEVSRLAASSPLPEVFYYSALFIFIAMVFDALDGPVARLSKQASDFGAQLDSLCDAISFGAAPAFLMLKVSYVSVYPTRLLWVIAVLYMLCAVLRLARFNVKNDPDHDSFIGLPSPAAAAMVASMVVIGPELAALTDINASETRRRIGEYLTLMRNNGLPIVTLAVACLMVSRIRYPHVFNQLFRGRRSFQHLVKLIFILVTIFAVHEFAIPLICCYFAITAPLRALWQRIIHYRKPAPPTTEERPAA